MSEGPTRRRNRALQAVSNRFPQFRIQAEHEQVSEEVPRTQQNTEEMRERQASIDRRVRELVLPEQVSEFPECIICANILNNIDGPGPSTNCRENCNDAIKVCANGHIFHRGCILEACNVEGVDTYAQMNYESTNILKRQERKENCPICQTPLIGVMDDGCDVFYRQPAVSIEELKDYKKQNGGKKKRKQTKRKIKKRKQTKRKIKKRKLSRNRSAGVCPLKMKK